MSTAFSRMDRLIAGNHIRGWRGARPVRRILSVKGNAVEWCDANGVGRSSVTDMMIWMIDKDARPSIAETDAIDAALGRHLGLGGGPVVDEPVPDFPLSKYRASPGLDTHETGWAMKLINRLSPSEYNELLDAIERSGRTIEE